MKTDDSGVMEWDAVLDTISVWSTGRCVQETFDGGYVVAGTVYPGDFCIIKTDDLGNPEWETAFGGSNYDYCFSVQQTTDGGYILAGTTESFGAGQNDIWLVKVVPPVGIENESISLIPSEYLIASLAPNPFASSMTISYSLPETGQIELSVYSLSGRLIDCLVSSQTEYGEHQYIWYPSSLESGCYVIRLHAGGRILTETCVHLK